MIVLVFDLSNHELFQNLNERIRKTIPEVHAVSNNLHDLPTGDYSSAIDQVWYSGQVLSKLADMVSGNVIDNQAILVYNINNSLLSQAIKELLPNNAIVDITDYDSLYR